MAKNWIGKIYVQCFSFFSVLLLRGTAESSAKGRLNTIRSNKALQRTAQKAENRGQAWKI
jgi:hypothetical protein